MSVHIGEIIKNIVKSQQLDIGDFANKISYTRRNIYKIFNKQSIDTELLVKISKVLGENLFFRYLTDEEIAAYRNSKIKAAELMTALKELQATMTAMNEEKEMKELVKKKRAALRNKKKK